MHSCYIQSVSSIDSSCLCCFRLRKYHDGTAALRRMPSTVSLARYRGLVWDFAKHHNLDLPSSKHDSHGHDATDAFLDFLEALVVRFRRGFVPASEATRLGARTLLRSATFLECKLCQWTPVLDRTSLLHWERAADKVQLATCWSWPAAPLPNSPALLVPGKDFLLNALVACVMTCSGPAAAASPWFTGDGCLDRRLVAVHDS